MILTAHQPIYLPWLGLFHKIALSELFVWFDDVQYQTKDWNNRNKIKTKNGPIWLTVPVLSKNHFDTKVGKIKINNDLPWAKKHLKSIQLAYSKSEFFDKYFDFFIETYNRDWILLADLNFHILNFFLDELKLKTPIVKLSELNINGKKSDLVLNMCKYFKAESYIFGEQGKNYADESSFLKANVKPLFQKYEHPTYNQLHGGFISKLAIIDLLFNMGPESYNILMSGNISEVDFN